MRTYKINTGSQFIEITATHFKVNDGVACFFDEEDAPLGKVVKSVRLVAAYQLANIIGVREVPEQLDHSDLIESQRRTDVKR